MTETKKFVEWKESNNIPSYYSRCEVKEKFGWTDATLNTRIDNWYKNYRFQVPKASLLNQAAKKLQ